MGRPKKVVQEVVSNKETVTLETTAPVKETVVVRSRDEISQSRPKRTPLHEQRDKMTVAQKPGFIRRWVNDVGNRVERFITGGYRIVDDKNVAVGDEAVTNNNVSLGTGARKNVGRTRSSDSTTAVLMEIPIGDYEADQKAKQKLVDASEEVIKRKIHDKDFYGEYKNKSEVKTGR